MGASFFIASAVSGVVSAFIGNSKKDNSISQTASETGNAGKGSSGNVNDDIDPGAVFA